jgi:hypothetical protein
MSEKFPAAGHRYLVDYKAFNVTDPTSGLSKFEGVMTEIA